MWPKPTTLPVSSSITPFAQALPDEFKDESNPVKAYRAYYNGRKVAGAKWTNRDKPKWVA